MNTSPLKLFQVLLSINSLHQIICISQIWDISFSVPSSSNPEPLLAFLHSYLVLLVKEDINLEFAFVQYIQGDQETVSRALIALPLQLDWAAKQAVAVLYSMLTPLGSGFTDITTPAPALLAQFDGWILGYRPQGSSTSRQSQMAHTLLHIFGIKPLCSQFMPPFAIIMSDRS